MDRDQLEDLYPNATDVIETTFSSTVDWAYNDRPDNVLWTDNRRQRVRIAQCHWSETRHLVDGDVQQARHADGYSAVTVQGSAWQEQPAG